MILSLSHMCTHLLGLANFMFSQTFHWAGTKIPNMFSLLLVWRGEDLASWLKNDPEASTRRLKPSTETATQKSRARPGVTHGPLVGEIYGLDPNACL